MAYLLEVIGFNLDACVVAQRAGAKRIELCDNPGDGGTTPSYGFIRAARKKLSIDLFPIIRPRGGDFFYTEDDFEIMKQDILICKQLGCDGIVTGILLPSGDIDVTRSRELVELAYPMEATFHRAFDRVAVYEKALEDVIASGFQRILSSGLHPNAEKGCDILKTLVDTAGDRIIIMPGSGVRSNNIAQLMEKTGATEFHSSASKVFGSSMDFRSATMNEDLKYIGVDEEEVKAIVAQFPTKSEN